MKMYKHIDLPRPNNNFRAALKYVVSLLMFPIKFMCSLIESHRFRK